jgi:hypothetical protein
MLINPSQVRALMESWSQTLYLQRSRVTYNISVVKILNQLNSPIIKSQKIYFKKTIYVAYYIYTTNVIGDRIGLRIYLESDPYIVSFNAFKN